MGNTLNYYTYIWHDNQIFIKYACTVVHFVKSNNGIQIYQLGNAVDTYMHQLCWLSLQHCAGQHRSRQPTARSGHRTESNDPILEQLTAPKHGIVSLTKWIASSLIIVVRFKQLIQWYSIFGYAHIFIYSVCGKSIIFQHIWEILL